MKSYKRMTAVLLTLMLAAGMLGCLVPKENDAKTPDAPTDSAETAAPAEQTDFDPEAVAIELGEIKITAGEISETYNSFMSMLESYYGSAPTDEASVKEYRAMAVNELVHDRVPEWKAKSLGVALDAEKEAEIEADAAAEVDSMRNGFILDYAVYYGGAAEDAEYKDLTEEQINIALEQIASELTEYFGEGYTFDQYLAEQHEMLVKDRRNNALIDALKEKELGETKLTDAQIDAWYEETLAKQKETFDGNPLEYREQAENVKTGVTNEPVLYQPDGFMKVQLVSVAPENERDLKIDENCAKMAELEKEYGLLALNGRDADRQAEIATEYETMKAENEQLEEAFLGEARRKINAAYEALEEETPFADVMRQYNADGAEEVMLYVAGEDTSYSLLCEAAKDLLIGTYSEPILIDNVYYIIMRVETPDAGAIDRAEIEEEIRAAATEAEEKAAWESLYSEWETEAEQTAVYHEETYASIGFANQ